MTPETPFADAAGGTLVRVRVTPRAGRTEVAGVRDGTLLVRLAAPPVDGAANDALVGLLAGLLHLPKRAITILRGERGREKQIRIDGLPPTTVARRLSAPIRPS